LYTSHSRHYVILVESIEPGSTAAEAIGNPHDMEIDGYRDGFDTAEFVDFLINTQAGTLAVTP